MQILVFSKLNSCRAMKTFPAAHLLSTGRITRWAILCDTVSPIPCTHKDIVDKLAVIMQKRAFLLASLSKSISSIACSPEVEFCGYSAPHPSEYKIHLRIQMERDSKMSAPQALSKALKDLESLFTTIKNKYDESFAQDNFERIETPKINWEEVRAQAAANKEKKKQAKSEA